MKYGKCRAWHNGKMIYPSCAPLVYKQDDGPTRYCPVAFDIEGDIVSRLILMWATGLKDRNGKEIYGGDILHEIPELSEDNYQKRFGKVVYEENIGSFMVFVEGGYCHLNKGEWGRGNQLKFTEVIGNIYENPKLLEE